MGARYNRNPGDPNLAQDGKRQAPTMRKELQRDLKIAQHGTQNAQRGSQGSPLAHIGPKMAPSELQGRPKWLQRETNMAKVVHTLAPDSAQEDSRWPQEGHKDARRFQKSSQEAQPWPAKNVENRMKIEQFVSQGTPK